MNALQELRIVKFKIGELGVSIGELNAKLKVNPDRQDMRRIKVKKIEQLKALEERRHEIVLSIQASPYSLADVLTVIETLTDVQIIIANEGTESGHAKIRGFIDYLVTDAQRMMEIQS